MHATSPLTERSFRVFVSSTFRDMQGEREELVKRVFPQLRRLCAARGVNWVDVDLRWGVTDEQKAEGEVLPICAAEIDRCSCLIGLLGERGGWVPDALPPGLLAREPWLGEEAGRSVTEIELLLGLQRQSSPAVTALFYFRDPAYADSVEPERRGDYVAETPASAARVQRLKAYLRDSHRRGELRVAPREGYANPAQLGAWVLDDLTRLIGEKFPGIESVDPLERDALDHALYAASRTRIYVPRFGYAERLDAHVLATGAPLVVTGESGSGKSALLANWFLDGARAAHRPPTIVHFIGASSYSADWVAMVRRLIGEFGRHLRQPVTVPELPADLCPAFAALLARVAAAGKVVLVLDALNQLEGPVGGSSLAWLPPVLPPEVRLIVSTTPGPILGELESRGWTTLAVGPLEPAERVGIVEAYLAAHGKRLDAGQLVEITEAPQTANALFLAALLEELRLFGIREALAALIEHYLAAPNLPELYSRVLERWSRDYDDDRFSAGLALALLWAARRGLSEVELFEILADGGEPIPRQAWSRFFLAVESAFVVRRGMITFAHPHLREAIERRLLRVREFQHRIRALIVKYFLGQPLDQPEPADRPLPKEVSASIPLTARVCEEVPWQLQQMDRLDLLHEWLCDWNAFLSLYLRRPEELRAYWQALGAQFDVAESYRRALDRWEPEIARREPQFRALVLTMVMEFLKSCGHLREAEELLGRLAAVAPTLAERHLVEAVISGEKADLQGSRGDRAEVSRLRRAHLEACRQTFGPEHPQTALAMGALAKSLMQDGEYAEAGTLFEQALRVLRVAEGAEATAVLGLQHDQAHWHQEQEQFEAAERLFRTTLEQQRRLLGPDHPNTLSTVSCLGRLRRIQGAYAEAEELLRSAWSAMERVLGPRHPQTLFALEQLAAVTASLGRAEQSEQLGRWAMERREIALGADAPLTIESACQLAEALEKKGDPDDAATVLQRVVESLERGGLRDAESARKSLGQLMGLYAKTENVAGIERILPLYLGVLERTLGPEDPVTLQALSVQASLQARDQNSTAAETLFRRVWAVWRRRPDYPEPESALCLEGLGELLVDRGALSEAAAVFGDRLAAAREPAPAEAERLAKRVNEIAYDLERNRRFDEAEIWYRMAWHACRRWHGEDAPETCRAMSALGGVLFKKGIVREALELYERAALGLCVQCGEDDIHARLAAWGLCQVLELGGLAAGTKAYDSQSRALGLNDPSGREWPEAENKELRMAFLERVGSMLGRAVQRARETRTRLAVQMGTELGYGAADGGTRRRSPAPSLVEIAVRRGLGQGDTPLTLKCPVCGTIFAPEDSGLAFSILDEGGGVAMRCPGCGTMTKLP